MLFTPAFGVPSEEMLQDTLKSIIVSIVTLGCGVFFFWQQRRRNGPVAWHALLMLPLALAAYALASMAWSHAYLGGVEAARWLIFTLIVWLGMNTRLEDTEERILWGIHWGVTIASIWTAWQFWSNLTLFPQGPNPASTFVNRNFFAEYAICALPYSLYLLLRAKDRRETVSMAAIIGFNISALLMTGTRSALIALLVFCALLPLYIGRWRQQFEILNDSLRTKCVVVLVLLAALLGFGSISNKNPNLTVEYGSQSAIARASSRVESLTQRNEYSTGSFSIRSEMWHATLRMIKARPFSGIGAGAWEVETPVYQQSDTPTETDYYAHNEILQLLAEYGAIGWAFLGLLITYLLFSAWATWTDRTIEAEQIAPLRATALISILMLLVVCCAGFPWRLAGTGAMFALSLSFLAASDIKLNSLHPWLANHWHLKSKSFFCALAVTSVGLALAFLVSQRAANTEKYLVRSLTLALTISNSGDYNNPKWNSTKAEIVDLARMGVALNPHYRKLTPAVGDELARWGDWKNALWIWQSVLGSRPHVVALICNIARAHMELGNFKEAQVQFERAKRLQPMAPTVQALDLELLMRTGQMRLARLRAKELLQNGKLDYQLTRLAYRVGEQTQDWSLAIEALQIRIRQWPHEAVEAWINLGNIYAKDIEVKDDSKALSAYRAAIAATPRSRTMVTLDKIPVNFRNRL